MRGHASALLVVCLGGVGCDSAPVSLGGEARTSLVTEGARIRTLDEMFSYLGERVPGGFGGLLYDEEGRLVMLLVDTSQFDAAVDALIDAQLRPMTDPATFRQSLTVRAVRYPFANLQRWRVEAKRMNLPGAVSFDVAEDQNRVRIGVDGSPAAVEAQLVSAGVPQDALEVFTHPSNQADRAVSHTLNSKFTSLMGGISIEADDDLGSCTLGAVASHSTHGATFVTASHCTEVPGAFDGGIFHQPFVTTGPVSNRVGVEKKDLGFSSVILDDVCPSGKTCRKSDSALIDLDAGVGIQLGKVAKPTSGTNVSHSDTLNIYYAGDDCPWLSISTWSCPFIGRPFEIVGRSSGRRSGTLSVTCSDEPAPTVYFGTNKTFLCQGGATYSRQTGDSGAPVILDKGPYGTTVYLDEVRLFGLHWGHNGMGTSWFSWIWDVREETGTGPAGCGGLDFVATADC